MVKARSVFVATCVCVLLAAARANAGQITLAWDPNTETNIAGYLVEYGPASAPFTQRIDVGIATTWTFTSATPGVTYSFRVSAYNTNNEYSNPSAVVSGTASGTAAPTLGADRSSLAFGIISGAPQTRTAAQTVRLTQSGAGPVSWTASSSAAWLSVNPPSGSGSAALTVSLGTGALPSANSSATVTIAATGASNTIAPITVSFTVLSQAASQAPVGAVDTPANNATGPGWRKRAV
jgi:hypothetical protein